jgi:CheY-like chemotaxis protein
VPTPIILVVEDNHTGKHVLKKLLQMFDYESHFVRSGEEALSALATTKYAAVLMELNLPGMDGCECTKRIRRMEFGANNKTPVIALTGRTAKSDCPCAIKAGMNDYLSKPFEPEELRKVLLRHVYDAKYPNLKVVRQKTKEAPRKQKRAT